MKKNLRKFSALLILMMLVLQACALPIGGSGQKPAATDTPPSVSGNPPTVAPTTSVAEIVHKDVPANGSKQSASAHDNTETSIDDQQFIAQGENFDKERFERPFSADGTYLPDTDIQDFRMLTDNSWFYLEIQMAGPDPSTGKLNSTYGVQFDLSLDGRAEVLVLAKPPFSTDWSTDGVSVSVDKNGDVGGPQPTHSDTSFKGDGFEDITFDSGVGTDPDLAWARIKPGLPNVIEIAFKQSVLGDKPRFMWSVLASKNPIDPSKFYFSDNMTLADAGSPIKSNADYPLKAVSGFDNTCRVPFGFEATGSEPLGCYVRGPESVPSAPTGGSGITFSNICVKYPALCTIVIKP